MNNIEYKSRIDTLETKELLSNRANQEIINIKGAETTCGRKPDTIITKYNPNNAGHEYSKDFSLSKTIETFNEMQDILTVINKDEVAFKRIDIATDISIDFEEISKFLDFAHKCIRVKEKDGKAWANIDETDLNISNYLYSNKSKLEIEFYDKKKESNDKANYPTRMEIRFVRISSKDFKFHINKAISLWNTVPENLASVEQQMVNILKSKWIKEKSLNPGLTFAAFTYKYNKYIYTQSILKSIYAETGLKRAFKSWLQDYRKKYSIEFYTKTDLSKFSKNVIKSLKDYSKS